MGGMKSASSIVAVFCMMIAAAAISLIILDRLPLDSACYKDRHSEIGDKWRPVSESEMPLRSIPIVASKELEHGEDSRRVVLLGLDGADWRILQPMLEAGVLPNIEMLLSGGAGGILKTDFAYSPTSWTTIATGRSASVHGINTELECPFTAERLEPSNIKVRRIWEMIKDEGRTIAVYDFFFCSYKPAGPWGWIPKISAGRTENSYGLCG